MTGALVRLVQDLIRGARKLGFALMDRLYFLDEELRGKAQVLS